MEGAAQGGMIVLEQDVAMRAAEAWASMQPSADPESATEAAILSSRSWSPFTSSRSSYLVRGRNSPYTALLGALMVQLLFLSGGIVLVAFSAWPIPTLRRVKAKKGEGYGSGRLESKRIVPEEDHEGH
eukprot:scaffold116052_cov17-Tisochrysis_lutea.AAC.2